MTNKRLVLPDLLKGVAVLLMIQVHLTELFAIEAFFTSLPGRFSLFLGGVPAAPLFMAVMGFFISKTPGNLKTDIFRGFKLILWGLMLNIGLNFHLLSKIFYRTLIIDPLPYLFGVDILFLAGLSIIIISLFRKLFRENIFVWTILTLLAASAGTFLPGYSGHEAWITYVQAYFYGSAWWSYFPVFPWVTYSLLGFIAGIIMSRQNQLPGLVKYRLIITAISFFLIVLTFRFGFSVSADLPQYYHHGITFALWAAVFLIFMVTALSFTAEKYSESLVVRYLCWTGRNLTSFYVFQWLIIGNLGTALYKTQTTFSLPFWFAGVVIVTTLLVLGWSQRAILREIVK
ncbi:MAG: DUF1624 domain-containing protein [Lentimicrobium sp.]|nr:DUF1624 domain-containing protein [Lentimicrobium sp.]